MADSKLTALTAITTPLSTDVAYMVTDPGGTPLDRKVTWANATKALTDADTTTKGVVEIATAAEQGTQTTVGGTGATVVVAAANTVKAAVFTPAVLTGGTSATSVVGTWTAVTDGAFKITVDGTAYSLTAIDFSSGVSTMADVAGKIQTALQAATSSTETVTWSTDHFIISSVLATAASEISKCTAGASGTDISGAGGTAFMDSDGANGSIVNAALSAGENNAVLALSTGLTDVDLSAEQGIAFRRNRTRKRYSVGGAFVWGTAAPFANQNLTDQGSLLNAVCAATDNNVGGAELLRTVGVDGNNTSVADKNPRFWLPLRYFASTAQDGFVGCVDQAFDGTSVENGAMTLDHFGFIVQDATVYISVADGSTQTKVDITGFAVAPTTAHKYEASFDGTTAKFFLDGTPVGQITTNVPDGDMDSFIACVIADSTAVAKTILIDKEGLVEYDE